MSLGLLFCLLLVQYDYDGNGFIEVSIVSSSPTLPHRRTRLTFVLFIFYLVVVQYDEMVLYLAAVYRIVFKLHPEQYDNFALTPEQLAAATATECFAACDLNQDGKLSLEEFKYWFSLQEGAPTPTQATVLQAAESPVWLSLDEVRRLVDLKDETVQSLVQRFTGAHAGPPQPLTRRAFNTCLHDFVKPVTQDDAARARFVLTRLFDAFDTNGDGVVSSTELAAGLSVLCGGHRDDRVAAAFGLFDIDRDGFVSKQEMAAYLTSVFRVIFEMDPSRAVPGVSPEALALQSTEECFERFDRNHDRQLSFAEFREWYNEAAVMVDQEAGAGAGAGAGAPVPSAPSAPQQLTLQQMREAVGFDGHPVEEVLAAFQGAASADGTIHRGNFHRVVRRLLGAGHNEDVGLVDRVFDMLDLDSNGVVDASELGCGISILCAGTQEEKVGKKLQHSTAHHTCPGGDVMSMCFPDLVVCACVCARRGCFSSVRLQRQRLHHRGRDDAVPALRVPRVAADRGRRPGEPREPRGAGDDDSALCV